MPGDGRRGQERGGPDLRGVPPRGGPTQPRRPGPAAHPAQCNLSLKLKTAVQTVMSFAVELRRDFFLISDGERGSPNPTTT